MADPEARFLAESFLTNFSLGNETRELAGRESPIGCNIAVRRGALLRAGGFSPHLGAVGEGGGAYEETAVTWRIRDLGYRSVYEPRAVVDHYPDPARLSRARLRSRATAWGRCRYIAKQKGSVSIPLRCVRTLVVGTEIMLRTLALMVHLPSSRQRFVAELRLRGSVGKLRAIWANALDGQRYDLS